MKPLFELPPGTPFTYNGNKYFKCEDRIVENEKIKIDSALTITVPVYKVKCIVYGVSYEEVFIPLNAAVKTP